MAQPADLVRDVLALVGLNNTGNLGARQTTQFMNVNSIEDVDNFVLLETCQVREMVKQYQRAHRTGSMRIMIQNRLKGLIW